jgi:phosphate transport system permease protein
VTPPDVSSAAAAVQGSLATGRTNRGLEVGFKALLIACVVLSMGVLVVLLVDVLADGLGSLSPSFLTDLPSRIIPADSGIGPAISGTLWLMVVCAAFIIPVGVASAIYLEEYANKENRLNRFIEVNIQNLAAVPSIVYGILGLAFLVRGPIGMGRILIAGGLTLALLVLPVVIVAAREALRAVPPSIREGSMALGATKWQTIWKQTLPAALPGIATGVILALSRAIGETAPLIVVGAAAFSTFTPNAPTDAITALPIQIFNWVSDPREEYKVLAAAGIVVLMAILLAMNAIAIWLRNKYERKW